MKDAAGYELSGASAEGVQLLEKAAHELRCYIERPGGHRRRGARGQPGTSSMAHVLKAYLHLLGTEPGGLPVAARRRRRPRIGRCGCRRPSASAAHIAAIGHLAEGRWHAAGRALEDLSDPTPRDALALQVGHQIDFFTGDSRMLRDRIARALPAWSVGHAGLSRGARHARLRPGGNAATTPRRGAGARAASSSSRATAGRSMPWRM